MSKRRQFNLHYCSGCTITTRHAEYEATCCCLRCGAVKVYVRNNRKPGAWEIRFSRPVD